MKNVLVINSSLQGEQGNSYRASKQYLKTLTNDEREQVSVTHIDLNDDNIPHLSGAEMQAWGVAKDNRDEQQKVLAKISDDYIEQVNQADLIVLGVPMYNFGIPSVLKAFFDRIARAGVTFSYTENGPQGLLDDKHVVILAARGGKYEGTPLDTQSSYLTNFWQFLGVNKVTTYFIEGLAMGEESSKAAWEKFTQQISA